MSQEPNEHGQEEYYVDHDNSNIIGEGPARMLDDAAIHYWIVYPSDLRNLQSGQIIKMGTHVKLTSANPWNVQIGNVRYWYEQADTKHTMYV